MAEGKNPMQGRNHSENSKQQISKNRSGILVSKETKEKLKVSARKNARFGSKNNLWKGGVTVPNTLARHSFQYEDWRKAVFERDDYTCQKTRVKGGELVAHHILNFSNNKELRLDIVNGITLSKDSHKEFHKKYGKINNTKEQLIEFLNT